ncbi:fluoride efflux transporter CrcB [Mesorhizobium sp.]|uniref:fluoride efflux transporter CrcB n=1 Tax=Mesorhizobium sp. TaxID=1871066 RepID=UPI00120670EB|nr:fluoride efflux transporter CrcB [Mesorhizobium sp.]TIS53712.1 MAG: fluoride efflux transporter CrcB [Mesorhizobium sp.]TIS85982.1 MAG: fluoride efflux transporter CrcB [Mesorhizobium sp.]
MNDFLQGLLWVVLGSAIGGPARYFISGLIGRHIGETFPWGTVAVNVSGAFVIGLLAASAAVGAMSPMPAAWQFAVTGFLGSYTTVSSFSLQTLALVRDGQFLSASGNVVLSLLLCLSAVALGYAAGSAMLGGSA